MKSIVLSLRKTGLQKETQWDHTMDKSVPSAEVDKAIRGNPTD